MKFDDVQRQPEERKHCSDRYEHAHNAYFASLHVLLGLRSTQTGDVAMPELEADEEVEYAHETERYTVAGEEHDAHEEGATELGRRKLLVA